MFWLFVQPKPAQTWLVKLEPETSRLQILYIHMQNLFIELIYVHTINSFKIRFDRIKIKIWLNCFDAQTPPQFSLKIIPQFNYLKRFSFFLSDISTQLLSGLILCS